MIIVLGALTVATHLLIPSDENASEAPGAGKASDAAPVRPNVKVGGRDSAPAADPGNRPGLLRPDDPILNGLAMAPTGGVLLPDDTTGSVSRLASPKTLPAKPANDITGSLPRVPAASPAAPSQAAPAMPAVPAPDTALPAAIGSPALREAAAKNDPAAAYEVALRYAEGQGVPQNLAEAARWYERAANQGLAPAQFRLGSMYEKGLGVKKDIEAARKLYIAAADKGNAKAMHNLAVLHAEGVDGKPNFQVAAQWFRKAADRGVADSQYNLGILYARGIGVEQNLAESYKWFTLAAQQGDKDSIKKRDDLAARLDQQSLMAAKLAVQTWTPDPQPESATIVRPPPGGWDRPVAGVGPVKPRPRPAATPKPTP